MRGSGFSVVICLTISSIFIPIVLVLSFFLFCVVCLFSRVSWFFSGFVVARRTRSCKASAMRRPFFFGFCFCCLVFLFGFPLPLVNWKEQGNRDYGGKAYSTRRK